MTDIKNINNDNSDNIEIDLDFSDGLSDSFSDEFSDEITDFEDIADAKNLPFDDITQDAAAEDKAILDFTEDVAIENIDPINLPEEIEEFAVEVEEDIVDLVNVVETTAETIVGVSSVKEYNAKEDEDIIELVNKIEIPLSLPEAATSSLLLPEPSSPEDSSPSLSNASSLLSEDSSPSLSNDSSLLSDEHIVAMIEKVIEKRYGGQLDSMFSKALDNILNRQLDDIKKKFQPPCSKLSDFNCRSKLPLPCLKIFKPAIKVAYY